MIVISKALGKGNIDEVIALSRLYKETVERGGKPYLATSDRSKGREDFSTLSRPRVEAEWLRDNREFQNLREGAIVPRHFIKRQSSLDTFDRAPRYHQERFAHDQDFYHNLESQPDQLQSEIDFLADSTKPRILLDNRTDLKSDHGRHSVQRYVDDDEFDYEIRRSETSSSPHRSGRDIKAEIRALEKERSVLKVRVRPRGS